MVDVGTLQQAKNDAKRRYARMQDAVEIPIFTRCQPPHANSLSDGTVTGRTFKLKHVALRTTRRVRFAFGNFYGNGAGNETANANDITVKFSIEDPVTGARIIANFGGVQSVTIKPGALIWTDWMYVPAIQGQTWFSYTYVSVGTLGQKWPNYVTTQVADVEGSSTSDVTVRGSGTISGGAFVAYGPHASQGTALVRTPTAVALAGDSISVGTGDVQPDLGFLVRALTAPSTPVPYQRLGCNGERIVQWRFPEMQRRRLIPTGTTHCICEYGINDFLFSGSGNLANLKVYLLQFWTEMYNQGIAVAQTTITPTTTSTDNWATTTNQTVKSFESERVNLNDWLRAGAPIDPTTKAAVAVGTSGALLMGQTGHPLQTVFEVADILESARNSGIWKVGYNSLDGSGTHPSNTAHAAAAAALTVDGKYGFASWVSTATAIR